MAFAHRARISVETLEPRETPSATTETFDFTTPPALPNGWATWSSDGTAAVGTAAGLGVGGSGALVTSGTSRTAARAWTPDTVGGDTGAAATLKLDSLVPAYVFARGSNLNSATPTYLAAVVTRGVKVDLQEVADGQTRSLGGVASPKTAYFSGGWVRVTIVPSGSTVAVQVVRQDTGQFLNANGTWQAAATNAITGTTTLPVADGQAGVGRGAQFAGTAAADDFALIAPAAPPPPPSGAVHEAFDSTAVGTTPAGWKGWSNDGGSAFKVSAARAFTPLGGFNSAGTSTSSARAWSGTAMPADVDASAAVYLDGLIPAQLFVRGTNLDTAKPSYYALSVARGLNAQIVKVVDGVPTTLASINSKVYFSSQFSSQWVRLRLTANGDDLQAVVYRADTQQWLSPDGTWSDQPDAALSVRDGSLTGGGNAGVARPALYSGSVNFDDFDAQPAADAAGPAVTVTRSGTGAAVGEVAFRAATSVPVTRVEFRLAGQLRDVEASAPAEWVFDSTTVPNGSYTLTVRAFTAAGDIGSQDFPFTVNNPNADPLPKPNIPSRYSHIRVAQLAYTGNPMGTTEKNLLRTSVDLVIPNPAYLGTINAVSPNTPQLIYSNVSNLYQGLLTDWLAFADKTGASREQAFYHVTKATPFTGSSPSSQPVTWFWGGYQSNGGAVQNVTSALKNGASTNLGLGAAGTWTAIGYTDRFREMNVTVKTPAASGWSGVWEYAAGVDAAGNPTGWAALPLLADGTFGFRQNGAITFDPPADWRAASVGGSDRLFYVRLRATAGEAAQAPVLKTVFGRDYVRANGGTSGMIPAFDYAADKNGDGYLNDAEYAGRAAGKDARFVYESRLFYPYYGQMRFVTDPSPSAVRKWAADYHARLLDANPLADGIFMDNANGNLPFQGVSVLEPTTTFSADSGALIAAVSRKIAPRWVLANTSGGVASADPIASGSAGVFEEYVLRPLSANWSEVGDVANLVARRLATPGSPYVVLDSYPEGGSMTDPRTQLGALAYYYLVADPERTMLMFFGGAAPASTWLQHWTQAAAVNVGKPSAAMGLFASGTDPANAALTYKVFSRAYENALVLYKPLSYAQGKPEGGTGNNTATVHPLNGRYRAVNADGSLGAVVTSVTLRNGEGAVLIKA